MFGVPAARGGATIVALIAFGSNTSVAITSRYEVPAALPMIAPSSTVPSDE